MKIHLPKPHLLLSVRHISCPNPPKAFIFINFIKSGNNWADDVFPQYSNFTTVILSLLKFIFMRNKYVLPQLHGFLYVCYWTRDILINRNLGWEVTIKKNKRHAHTSTINTCRLWLHATRRGRRRKKQTSQTTRTYLYSIYHRNRQVKWLSNKFQHSDIRVEYSMTGTKI